MARDAKGRGPISMVPVTVATGRVLSLGQPPLGGNVRRIAMLGIVFGVVCVSPCPSQIAQNPADTLSVSQWGSDFFRRPWMILGSMRDSASGVTRITYDSSSIARDDSGTTSLWVAALYGRTRLSRGGLPLTRALMYMKVRCTPSRSLATIHIWAYAGETWVDDEAYPYQPVRFAPSPYVAPLPGSIGAMAVNLVCNG
jgi:hypothetical protein